MNRTPRPIDVPHAVLGLLLSIVGTSATAGEPHEALPTSPTLYYACMTVVGNVEYDTAAFATKNPGPQFSDHEKHVYAIQRAFEAYLKQKYGYNGYAQCTRPNSLAEAKKWLQWRREYQVGRNYKLVQTDWTYSGGGSEASTAPAPDTAKAEPAAQPAAPASSSTAFYACVTVTKDTQYDNAVFEASNDFGTNRRVYFSYRSYADGTYGNLGVTPICVQKPTHAEAQKYFEQMATGRNIPRVATHWVYSAEPTASAAAATTHVATATPEKTARPPVTPPKPSAPPPVAAPVAPKPSVTAASAAPNGIFVNCKAEDLASGQRLYNPPVQVSGGDYAAWQASYSKFVMTNYKFDRGVSCNKLPTLAESQSYFKEITDTARLTTQINGKPAPLIITHWKFP